MAESKYLCVATNKKYSKEQMRNLFRFAEYNGYPGTFDDWMQMEISKGYIKLVTE